MFERWFKKKSAAAALAATASGSVRQAPSAGVAAMLQSASEHHRQGHYEQADRLYRKVLAADPRNFDAVHLLGLSAHQQGKSEEAVELVTQAVSLDPTKAVAFSNLAEICRVLGRFDEAKGYLRKALELKPSSAEAHYNLGVLLKGKGDLDGAIACFRKTLSYRPAFADAHFSLGNAYIEQGKLDEAEACYKKALEIRPDLARAYVNLGNVYRDKGEQKKAHEAYTEALSLDPSLPETHANLGALLRDERRFDEALGCYREAVALNANLAYAHYGMGHVLSDQDHWAEALDCYRTALSLDPESVDAHWAFTMAQLPCIGAADCNPDDYRSAFAQELSALDQWFDAPRTEWGFRAVGVQQPFLLAYQERNNRELLAQYGNLCARLMHVWQEGQRLIASPAGAGSKINVGIVSAQLRNSAVWNDVVKGWLQHLNQSRYALQVFYLKSESDKETESETEFARGRAAHFEQGGRSLRDWAQTIIDRNLDVLIYPEIGIDPMTVKLASLRLAPTQVAAWGHPETSGLPTIDYYLSAADFEPPGSQQNYTEKLEVLPHLGCAYEPRPIEAAEFDLAGVGIVDHVPILVCPGSPLKYAPEHDFVLPAIAKKLGRCQMVFFESPGSNRTERLVERLEVAFSRAGMTLNDYLVVIPWLPKSQFYSLMRRADVYLDTIGCSGFDTAMQAVECALPIVTREGHFMRGRLASGILKRMGLAELVAATEAEYVDVAAKLVLDSDYRGQIKRQIEGSRHLLYNDLAPVRALEEFLSRVANRVEG